MNDKHSKCTIPYCFVLQGKGDQYTYWLLSEDKSIRQKRLYQVITPAILAQEKSFMAEASHLSRGSPRNQSQKLRSKKEAPPPTNENSSFLELIRNSESSSSLRCKSNPYKGGGGSAGNLSTRRFSNETHIPSVAGAATVSAGINGCPPNRPHSSVGSGRIPIHKANSVDCGDHLPSIIVDKALDDLDLQPKETDKLLWGDKFQCVEENKGMEKSENGDYVVLTEGLAEQAETNV